MSDQLNKNDAVKEGGSAEKISDKDLDNVSGGSTINPQPLPPCHKED